MSEYQITSWHDLPSMVTARQGDSTAKLQLAPRLQEAIDEAAMLLGETDSEAYLNGWSRSEWIASEGDPADVARAMVKLLEDEWSAEKVAEYLVTLKSR